MTNIRYNDMKRILIICLLVLTIPVFGSATKLRQLKIENIDGSLVSVTDPLPVSNASLPLPSGAATEAKQDDTITSLALRATEATLALQAALTDTQPVSAASLPLPAGASTEDKQDDQIAAQLDSDQVDPTTNAVNVIDYSHHEIHEGSHYFVKTWFLDTGGNGSQTFFAFFAPTSAVRVHAKAIIKPDVDFTINIYEGSGITGGTPVTGRNNNRDEPDTPDLLMWANPAHTSPGAVIWSARNGGGRGPVGVSPGFNYEILARTGALYVFELIKNIATDGVVDIDFFWYEHTPI